jgi:SagB-type dehydrogenase family enzyme
MPISKQENWKNEGRAFLKSDRWAEWRSGENDQKIGVPVPALQKPVTQGTTTVSLPAPRADGIGTLSLAEAIARRRTERQYAATPLSLAELSFLLWATQGVHEVIQGGTALRRTVPSGGARHPFETYLYVERVSGLEAGLYRYLSVEHQLALVAAAPDLGSRIDAGINNQKRGAAVVFVWSTIPYRTEWRYGFLSHKLIALDAGHVCQNLYLAATAIDAGVCAIDAYDQTKIDAAIGVDGRNELTIYCATVGKLPEGSA